MLLFLSRVCTLGFPPEARRVSARFSDARASQFESQFDGACGGRTQQRAGGRGVAADAAAGAQRPQNLPRAAGWRLFHRVYASERTRVKAGLGGLWDAGGAVWWSG